MDDYAERDISEFCNILLRLLGETNPKLSTSISKKTKNMKFQSKLDLKLFKVQELYRFHKLDFELLAGQLNKLEFKPRISPLNCIDLIERKLKYLNPAGEQTGGNYRSKT